MLTFKSGGYDRHQLEILDETMEIARNEFKRTYCLGKSFCNGCKCRELCKDLERITNYLEDVELKWEGR